MNKHLNMTPAEAVTKPDAELRPKYNASREKSKPYMTGKVPKIGDKCRYLVKMRKNIRTLGYKAYKAKHLSSRIFTVRNITKNEPRQYYVDKKWRDRDEIVLISGTDAVTEARLEG